MLERINNNSYKIGPLGEYNLSAIFIIFYLSPFTMDTYGRTNHFEERENDTSLGGQFGHFNTRGQNGYLVMVVDPITKARAKRLRKSFGNLAKSYVEKIQQEFVGDNLENKQSRACF